jgi:hypothetical protein
MAANTSSIRATNMQQVRIVSKLNYQKWNATNTVRVVLMIRTRRLLTRQKT